MIGLWLTRELLWQNLLQPGAVPGRHGLHVCHLCFSDVEYVSNFYICDGDSLRVTYPRSVCSTKVDPLFCSQLTSLCLWHLSRTTQQSCYACSTPNTDPIWLWFLTSHCPVYHHSLEPVNYRRPDGIAKVLGTVICVAGALLMSFYQGPVVVGHGHAPIHHGNQVEPSSHRLNFSLLSVGKWQFGALLLILQNLAWSGYIILQVKTSSSHPPFWLAAQHSYHASRSGI